MAVLGNHDWWFDGERVRTALEEMGIAVLENQALRLEMNTHGGQVRLPLFGAPIVPSRFGQRYAAGLIEEEERLLFVTPGIGTSIIPVPFGVPAEISLLTLVGSPCSRAEAR